MSELYYFSTEQKEIVQRTNLVELLRSQGETLKPSGSEYEWLCQGQKVTVRRNLWYHQYEQVGGNAIDFVRKFMGKSYVDAVEYLLRQRRAGADGSAAGLRQAVPPGHKI